MFETHVQFQPEARTSWQRSVGVFLILAVLCLSWLGADTGAHRHIHPDAAEADHACAVTQFAHCSELWLLVAALVVARLAVAYPRVDPIEKPRCTISAFTLPFAHAPPQGS